MIQIVTKIRIKILKSVTFVLKIYIFLNRHCRDHSLIAGTRSFEKSISVLIHLKEDQSQVPEHNILHQHVCKINVYCIK